MAHRTKRLWTEDEETRSICLQTMVPEIAVARRYAVNVSLIFKWLRDHSRRTPYRCRRLL